MFPHLISQILKIFSKSTLTRDSNYNIMYFAHFLLCSEDWDNVGMEGSPNTARDFLHKENCQNYSWLVLSLV